MRTAPIPAVTTAPPRHPERTNEPEVMCWAPPMVRRGAPLLGSACCCPARPMYQVVLPPPPGREAVELLLCGHHYRASTAALSAAGAWVYDIDGKLLGPSGETVDGGSPVVEGLGTFVSGSRQTQSAG